MSPWSKQWGAMESCLHFNLLQSKGRKHLDSCAVCPGHFLQCQIGVRCEKYNRDPSEPLLITRGDVGIAQGHGRAGILPQDPETDPNPTSDSPDCFLLWYVSGHFVLRIYWWLAQREYMILISSVENRAALAWLLIPVRSRTFYGAPQPRDACEFSCKLSLWQNSWWLHVESWFLKTKISLF